MNDRCTYCKKPSGDEPFRNTKGLPVCNGCAAKGGLLMLKLGTALLMLTPKRKPKKPKPKYRLNPNAKPKPKPKPSKKRKKKMKRFSKPFTAFLCLMAFAAGGFTVRCDTDDDKDKDKAKQMEALNHMLSEHMGEASIKAGDEPDFECFGQGLDDVKDEIGFDMIFVHGCNEL